jgi:hypothetical protein
MATVTSSSTTDNATMESIDSNGNITADSSVMVWYDSIYIIGVPISTDTDALLSKYEALLLLLWN